MIIENLINGSNFLNSANHSIEPDKPNYLNGLKDGDIIFCKTDMVLHLFDTLRNVSGKFKLITHKSDYAITKDYYDNKPKCIDVWFAQNVDYEVYNLIPIPIGIENHEGHGKGTCIDIPFLENDLWKLNEPKQNKIYLNFSPHTHPKRKETREFLISKNKENCLISENYDIPQRDYYKQLQSCKFVASPRGNGIDCHRTWEALLVGTIPIVEKHFMYDHFKIPVIQIDSWEQTLDIDWLNNEAEKLNLNNERIFMPFWKHFIKNY